MTGKHYEPVKHYGHSLYRPDLTACGKPKSDVMVTPFPVKVTCDVCVEELKLQADEGALR